MLIFLVIGYCLLVIVFCLLSSAARLLFQFDTAKLVNIFRSTKYFDKKFQNIFNYFFSLPREKVFPAQRAKFSWFLNDYKIRRWYAGTLGHFDKRGDKDWVINGLIEYIYLKYIIIILSYVPPPPLSFSNQANEPAYQRTSEPTPWSKVPQGNWIVLLISNDNGFITPGTWWRASWGRH